MFLRKLVLLSVLVASGLGFASAQASPFDITPNFTGGHHGGGPGGHFPGPGFPGPGFPPPPPPPPVWGGISYQKAQSLTNVLYQAVLFRNPDQQGGSQTVNIIMQQGYQGFINSASSMPNSPEFIQNIYYRYSAYDIVGNFYRVFLGRQMDPGAQGWIQLVQQGNVSQAVQGIVTSQEFRQRWGL